jgi:hypothetical protein
MSILSSVIVFVSFLSIAYVTTEIDPATGSNAVIDYINTFTLDRITNSIAGDEGNRKAAERMFGNMLYTATAISVVSALVFECLCLTKSRALMRRVHPDSRAMEISKLMLFDILSTVIAYVVFYTFVWFLCTIVAEAIFDVAPASPMMVKRLLEKGEGRFRPTSIIEWLDQFWFLIWHEASAIIRAMYAEIRSGFNMFVVVNDDFEIALIDRSVMNKAGNTSQQIQEFFRVNPALITKKELFHSVRYTIFTLPLSLTLASAIFTTVWTFIVASSLLIVRSVCHASATVRKTLRVCCVNPWNLWDKVIRPGVYVWAAGALIMWLIG